MDYSESDQTLNVLDSEPALYALRREQLRSLCRDRGLTVAGEKQSLVTRLLEYNAKMHNSGGILNESKRRPTEISFDMVDVDEGKEAEAALCEFGRDATNKVESFISHQDNLKGKLGKSFKMGSRTSTLGDYNSGFVNAPTNASPYYSVSSARRFSSSQNELAECINTTTESENRDAPSESKSQEDDKTPQIRLVQSNCKKPLWDVVFDDNDQYDCKSIKLSLSPSKTRGLGRQKSLQENDLGKKKDSQSSNPDSSKLPVPTRKASNENRENLQNQFERSHKRAFDRMDSIVDHPSAWRKPKADVMFSNPSVEQSSKRVKVDPSMNKTEDETERFMDVEVTSDTGGSWSTATTKSQSVSSNHLQRDGANNRELGGRSDERKDHKIAKELSKEGWMNPKTPDPALATKEAKRKAATAKKSRRSTFARSAQGPKPLRASQTPARRSSVKPSEGVATKFFRTALNTVRSFAGYGNSGTASHRDIGKPKPTQQNSNKVKTPGKATPAGPAKPRKSRVDIHTESKVNSRTPAQQPGFLKPTTASINRSNEYNAQLPKPSSRSLKVEDETQNLRQSSRPCSRVSQVSQASNRSAKVGGGRVVSPSMASQMATKPSSRDRTSLPRTRNNMVLAQRRAYEVERRKTAGQRASLGGAGRGSGQVRTNVPVSRTPRGARSSTGRKPRTSKTGNGNERGRQVTAQKSSRKTAPDADISMTQTPCPPRRR